MIKFLPPKPFRILFLAAAFTCFLASAYAQPAVQAGPEVAAFNTNAVDLLNLPPANGPVVVLAAFHLLNISAIDDAAETVEFSAVTTLTWQDPRQAFDPLQEGVEEKVLSGAFQFNELAPAWYPQVVLSNAAGQSDSRAVLLRVKPDGTNILVETIDALAKVSLGMRRYPFDRHRMELVFEIFGFTADEVVLATNPHWVSAQAQMLQVPQWSLEGVGLDSRTIGAGRALGSGEPSSLVVTMDMKRMPFFMVRLVGAPLFLIVMLSWSVFWMERSSLGDRMSVSFVGILTAVAYQMMVSSTLPQIAYMTLLNAFLNFSMMLMCATVLINLVVGAADKRGDHQLGDLIDRRCRWIFPLVYAVLIAVAGTITFTLF